MMQQTKHEISQNLEILNKRILILSNSVQTSEVCEQQPPISRKKKRPLAFNIETTEESNSIITSTSTPISSIPFPPRSIVVPSSVISSVPFSIAPFPDQPNDVSSNIPSGDTFSSIPSPSLSTYIYCCCF